MSALLDEVAKGIMTKFTATISTVHNTFYTAVAGKLYKGRAKRADDYPYSIFFVVTAPKERTFTEEFRNVLIQFSHFSKEPNAIEAENINQYCNDLFDEVVNAAPSTFNALPLTVSGATVVWFRSTDSPGALPEDSTTSGGTSQIWQCITDYEMKLSLT